MVRSHWKVWTSKSEHTSIGSTQNNMKSPWSLSETKRKKVITTLAYMLRNKTIKCNDDRNLQNNTFKISAAGLRILGKRAKQNKSSTTKYSCEQPRIRTVSLFYLLSLAIKKSSMIFFIIIFLFYVHVWFICIHVFIIHTWSAYIGQENMTDP